jgi:hypothetical protein
LYSQRKKNLSLTQSQTNTQTSQFKSTPQAAAAAGLHISDMSDLLPDVFATLGLLGFSHALYWLVSYFGPTTSPFVLFYSIHAITFWVALRPWRFFAGLYELSLGDGPLDEWLPILTEDCRNLTTYLTAFCLIYNIFGAWSLIKLLCLYLVLPSLLAAVLLNFSSVARELFAGMLPIAILSGGKMIPYTVGAVVSTYIRITAIFQWTGWFVDVDPIDEDCPEYVYCDLPTNRSIRILEVSRKYPWGPLQLELYPYDLESCPTYEAISYRWGDATKVRLITIGGKKLEITANAFQVISRRASYWDPKLIWIDSVCINQKDLEERSRQVQLMRELYRNASRVIAWLGEAAQPLPAIPALQVFIFLLNRHAKINYHNLGDEELKWILQIGTKEWGWRNLFDLLQNPFWRRAWIIQEIAVAAKVHLCLGGVVFNWDSFAEIMASLQSTRVGSLFVFTTLEDASANILAAIEGRDQILHIAELRTDLHLRQSLPLGSLLYSTSFFSATDPRDRVFALLGMSDMGPNDAILPDYTQDVSSLFVSTSRYVITNEHDQFRSLHLAGIGHRRCTANLPSWVVDWNAEIVSRSFWKDSDSFPYQASKGYSGSVQSDEASRTISVTGFQFDEIKNYSFARELSSGPGVMSQAKVMQRSLVESCDLADVDSPEPYKTGQSRFEAFWRCCVGDRNRTPFNRPADPRIGESFYASRRFVCASSYFDPSVGTAEESLEKMRRVYPERQWRSEEEAEQNIGEEDAETRLFQGATSNGLGRRKFAITKSGYYAVVPPLSEVGDIICLIDGAQTPFVLRRDADGLQLVGECYVHGTMDGEIAGDGVRETFVLH